MVGISRGGDSRSKRRYQAHNGVRAWPTGDKRSNRGLSLVLGRVPKNGDPISSGSLARLGLRLDVPRSVRSA